MFYLLAHNDFMITGILLSAGLSQRFGSPKALADLHGRTVIEHLQSTLLTTACDNIIVVLGNGAQDIMPFIFIHSRIRVVYNKNYNLGQTSSLQEGLKAVDAKSQGILLLPVDCPLVQASTINKLIDHFKKTAPDILIPSYLHKKGHPPILHQRLIPEVFYLPLSRGLNSLFAGHPPQILEMDDPGIVKSFNTLEEWEKIKE
ncbi:MAG: nucleotidyltransferase family protein [Candidatus Omnitrophica bacterium]|nr:nucleotidyltransferase family protein [Candidatus Omnitrophota bacterium]MDE2223563.1 nucleotidyltransferase family protein [Candidatus Omnitrophota bacterium]